MIKASVGALSVIVALALILPYAIPAQAARIVGGGGAPSTPPASSTPPTSSTPPGTSSDPGGPGGPGTGGPNNPGGNGGDLPPLTSEEEIARLEQTCNGALATLVKIPERMVVSFDNEAGVNVIPVCDNGAGHQAKIDASQAMPLQTAIANNPTLLAALRAKGYSADDVVGVVLINGAATLYVHKHA